RLPRVSRVALSDRDAEEHARSAHLMRPDRPDVWDAGLLDVLTQQSGSSHGAVARQLIGRALRRTAQKDRVVAVVDSLDVEDRLLAHVATVVSGPLSKGALLSAFVRVHESLQGDLRVGRNRQARQFSPDDLDGFAPDPSGDVVLADPIRGLAA